MHQAAWQGHVEVAQLLINAGASVEATKEDGATSLHLAASRGKEATVRLLLQAGARVDAKNNRRAVPLNLAVIAGHEGVTHQLLDANSPVDARLLGSEEQATHHAAWAGHISVVKVLLAEAKCDWNSCREVIAKSSTIPFLCSVCGMAARTGWLYPVAPGREAWARRAHYSPSRHC